MPLTAFQEIRVGFGKKGQVADQKVSYPVFFVFSEVPCILEGICSFDKEDMDTPAKAPEECRTFSSNKVQFAREQNIIYINNNK